MGKIEMSAETKTFVKAVAEELYKNSGYKINEACFDEKESGSDKRKNAEDLSREELAGYIDHTMLKPEATPDEIKKLCEEAKDYKFASVCVNPSYVALCGGLLESSGVKVCTVIGFPLGASAAETKIFETKKAIENGAEEIDMVINIGRLKAKDYNYVYEEIKAVVAEAKAKSAVCKVIIETCLLTEEKKIVACLIARDAGADFVKTSTGFGKAGATAADVALMKYTVGPGVKVKAAGGIRSRKDALDMIANGADRIGASAGIKIINGEINKEDY